MGRGRGREAERSWVARFEERARSGPDRIAVTCGGQTLSYDALDRAANRLARSLLESGSGGCTGALLPRGVDAVVAFLAVSKAGGTWLPLDPALPAERIAAILRDRHAGLVTTQALRESIGAAPFGALLVDAERDALDAMPDAPVDARAVEDAPAYILYTSGSSAAQRAVAVSRSALAAYADSLASWLDTAPDDVWLHTAAFGFSAAIRQLIAPLSAGAQLVLADDAERGDPVALLQSMRAHQVQTWDTVPSVWRRAEQVVAHLGADDPALRPPPSLRRVLLTGEPLARELVAAWRRHLGPHVAIWNLYSQTETAGTVSAHRLPAGPAESASDGPIPLGEPLPGVATYLLDASLRPVDDGEVGEICVAGDRLADGYVDDPARTAERFVDDPFAPSGGARLYRTGDLARRGADGELLWVGRSDRRVKIRGVSVDLEGIESALLALPSVREAAVVAPANERGDRALAAFVVSDVNPPPTAAELAGDLRRRLPPQSVPATFAFLGELPRTASGKLDREALPAPSQPEAPREPSGDESESLAHGLRRIWESVLGYRPADPGDDFFDRGGDSLQAVDLFIAIEATFGVRLPPATLFNQPTLAGLTAEVRRGAGRTSDVSVIELAKGGARPPLFFVHTIWDFMPHYRSLTARFADDQPVYVIEPLGEAAGDAPTDLEPLVARYAHHVRAVAAGRPVMVAGLSIGGLVAYAVAEELERQGSRPACLFLLDSAAPVLRLRKRELSRDTWAWRARWLARFAARQWRALRLPVSAQWRRTTEKLRRVASRSWRMLRRPGDRARHEQRRDAYRRVADAYEPGRYDGPVVLFRSEASAEDPSLDRDLGWQPLAPKLEIVPVRGDHCSMIFEPHIDGFAAAMQRCMDAVATRVADVDAESASAPTVGASDAEIRGFAERSRELCGKRVREREPWNNAAHPDAIRHFAHGTADDNPLWLNADYAAASPHGRLLAPPAFLISVAYPVVHGSPVGPPLASLLRDVEFEWHRVVGEGDALTGVTEQGEVRMADGPGGRPRVYIDTHTRYSNGDGDLVATAKATVVRLRVDPDAPVVDREIRALGADERDRIVAAIDAEARTGDRVLSDAETAVGSALPPIVRGPFAIGDLICWNAAIGPAYRPGPLGFKDTRDAPGFVVVNPATGWPLRFTHQHEDPHLTRQRGMPAPFDNGIMRFAWIAPLLTNWMGDRGFLARLKLTIHAPVIYGDTNWYAGTVVERSPADDAVQVRVRVTGTNQLGAVTTTGEADVRLPAPAG